MTVVATAFEDERGRLFGLAYRMLGSVADAEDVVQDAYLRWAGADQTAIHEPGRVAHDGDHPAGRSTGCAAPSGSGPPTSDRGCPSRCSPTPSPTRASRSSWPSR